MTNCPKCKVALVTSSAAPQGECPKCAWMPPRPRQTEQHRPAGVCSHAYNGQDCPMPGSYRVGKDYWCRWHQHPENRGESQMQYEFYRDMSNPELRAEMLAYWYPSMNDSPRQMCERLVEENPEWQRGRDEPKSEYVARMKALRDELLKGATKKVAA